MASPIAAQPSLSAWVDSSILSLEPKQLFPIGLAIILGAVFFIGLIPPTKGSKKFPLINPPSTFDFGSWDAKKRFALSSTQILEQGRTQYKDQLFRVMADAGEIIAIPSKYVNEVRNDKNLGFMESVAEDFHARIPGFGAFASGTESDGLVQNVVRKQLTKYLSEIVPHSSSSFPRV